MTTKIDAFAGYLPSWVALSPGIWDLILGVHGGRWLEPVPQGSIYLRGMTGTELLDLAGKYAGVFVTSVLGAGIGAYVGAYLKKKGENLATHEDVEKLVDQVAAITQTTKEIEAKISNEVWNRQRRWEMKRDALVEAMKVLGDVETAMSLLHLSNTGGPKTTLTKEEAAEMWNDALAKFKRSRILASIVCSDDVNEAFRKLEEFMITSIRSITRRESPAWFPEFRSHLSSLIDLVRNDLMPRSDES